MEQLGINYSDCIKTSTDIGKSTIYNICEGVQHVVPWGSADYLAFFAVAGLALLINVVVVAIVWVTLSDSPY